VYSGSSTTALLTAVSARRSAACQMAEHHPRPHPGPRQLAQPDRGLLLHRPAQAPHAQRFCEPRLAPRPADAVPTALPKSAKPFEWTFTRRHLDALLEKLRQKSHRLAA
jgi:hypothetical protein